MKSLFFSLAFFVAGTAYADCTLPAGNTNAMVLSTVQIASGKAGYAPADTVDLVEGVILYDQSDNKVKICNGTTWQFISPRCRVVQGAVTTSSSLATCAANEYLNSGGGRCTNGAFDYLHDSFPDGANKRWVADCYRRDGAGDAGAIAYAICCNQ